MCYCPTPTLHLNLALTGDGAFLLSLKKTHSVWFISVLNYGDTENVLINHLLLVIPMSYPCHYTNLCPHKPHKHAHTHTHTHTHTLTHTHTHALTHTDTHTHTHTHTQMYRDPNRDSALPFFWFSLPTRQDDCAILNWECILIKIFFGNFKPIWKQSWIRTCFSNLNWKYF